MHRYHVCTVDGLEVAVTARNMQDAIRQARSRLVGEPIIVMAWREARGTPVPCPYLPRRAYPFYKPADPVYVPRDPPP